MVKGAGLWRRIHDLSGWMCTRRKIAAIAWSAQQRLHRRYWALQNKSKPRANIVTALARELAGFVWAIGVETERALKVAKAA